MTSKLNRLSSAAFLLAGLMLCVMPIARADDAWLIADPAVVPAGESVWLGFVGGQVFPLSETLVAPEGLEALVDVHGNETAMLSGPEALPTATGRRETLAQPGIHVIAAQMLPFVVEMEGTQFDDYLSEERAADAILDRLSDDPEAIVTEEYTRFAKTLVRVGARGEDDTGYAAVVGHRLEIVPLADASSAAPGDSVVFEVLLDGYPWPDVPIAACREGFEEKTFVVETVTDASGQAEIPIDREGLWLVRAHFIRRTDGLRKAEWESFWATLTFRVGGEKAASSDAVGDESAEESARMLPDGNNVSLSPPLKSPLDDLYGFFSPYLRMLNDKAA